MSGIVVRDRRRALLLLAGSVEDFGSWMIDPKGAGRNSTSGLGAAKKIPCPTCTVTPHKSIKPVKGMKLDRFGRETPCPMCTKPGKDRGTGRVDADSTLEGDVVVQTADTTTPTKAPRTKKCEHCQAAGVLPNEQRCHWCRGEGRIVVDAFVISDDTGGELDPLDAYEKAIERRDSSGDYRQYQLLQAELRARSPHLLRPFRELYVDVPRKDAGLLPEAEIRFAEGAIRYFLEWMPAEIRVPRWVVEADEQARVSRSRVKGRGVSKAQRGGRDAEIVRRSARESVQVIAADLGLSERRVQQILDREEAA